MLNKTLLSCIILFLINIGIHAQKATDTLVAFKYYKKADSLLLAKNSKESIAFFKKALPIYKKELSWKRTADCYNKLAYINLSLKAFKVSENYAKEALKINSSYLSEESEQQATSYRILGVCYISIGELDKSFNYLKLALKIRQKDENNPEAIAISLNDMGSWHNTKGNYNTAITYLKKALEINIANKKYNRISNNYGNIGSSYIKLGNFKLALEYLKKSLDVTEKHEKNILSNGKDYNSIGITLIQLKRYRESIPYFFKALSIFKNNKNGQVSLSYTYMYFGIVYHYLGENDRALQYFNKSLNLRIKYFGKSHPLLVNNYVNMGAIYSLKNDFVNSMLFYEKALNINLATYGPKHHHASVLYTNMSQSLVLKGEYDTALKYAEKALNNNLTIFKKNNPEIAKSYSKIANIYQIEKKYDTALLYNKKGLKIMENAYGKENLLVSKFYYDIGVTYQKMKNHNKGLEYFNKALVTNTKDKSQILENVLNPNKFYDLQLLLKTVKGKSKVLQSQYIETNFRDYLIQSINLYNDADKIIDHIRKSFQNYKDKLALAKLAKEIYDDAIATQLLLYKNNNQKKALAQAWYFSEKSKANTLKELLENTNAKNFSELPNDLLLLEKRIKSDRAYYQSQIITEQSKDSVETKKIKYFENELFTVSQREDSIHKLIKERHPRYYQIKHKNKFVSVKAIQEKINKKTTILEFFTTDSTTYAFTISKNNVSVKELKILQLGEKIAQVNDAITSENTKTYKNTAHKLYKELITPISNQIVGDELIIIPDGPLWHLNFDLLLTQKTEEKDNRNLPYLIKEHAISYANTADLLFNPVEVKTEVDEIQNKCLAFSFFTEEESLHNSKVISLSTLRDTGDDLPGTRKEIRAISNILDGKYYYGKEAIETSFKQHANKYNILHLALHGEIDNKKPENSKLYFTKTKDTLEDNILYSHELFALNIPANLVVLSACNTGTGKVANGEGLMSLGNAFQYAGAKSLVLSRWEIPDKTTPELMTYFYTNLKKGMNKSKALQQAKLKYLNTTEAFYTNPFYWGSFYIIGNTDTISIYKSSNYMYYWIIGICIFLFGIYYFIIRKSKKTH